MLPSRNTVEFINPAEAVLTDSYGEELVLSNITTGNVLRISYESTNGKITKITAAGNFHAANRQNELDFLQHIDRMQFISERENNEVEFIGPFPEFLVRGYMENLSWEHGQARAPLFFNWSFDFIATTRPYQPVSTKPLASVLKGEGKDYVDVLVPAGIDTVDELAAALYDTNYSDFTRVRKIKSLNRLRPSTSRSISGLTLRVPVA